MNKNIESILFGGVSDKMIDLFDKDDAHYFDMGYIMPSGEIVNKYPEELNRAEIHDWVAWHICEDILKIDLYNSLDAETSMNAYRYLEKNGYIKYFFDIDFDMFYFMYLESVAGMPRFGQMQAINTIMQKYNQEKCILNGKVIDGFVF